MQEAAKVLFRGTVLLLAAVLNSCGRPSPTCATAAARGEWELAIPLCQARYERSKDPHAGLQWARGLNHKGDWDGAMRVARSLTQTSVSVEAYDVLAYAAQRSDDLPTWLEACKKAFDGHQASGDTKRAARAAHCLAGALLANGDMAGADLYAQIAIDKAKAVGDRQVLYYVLGRADILRQRGGRSAAEHVLESMNELIDDTDRMWFSLKRGILYVSLELHEAARRDLTTALQLASSRDRDVKIAVHLNLAWIARVEGDVAASLQHLADAEKEGAEPQELHFLRGLALFAGGRHPEAAAELRLAKTLVPQGQWLWKVPYYEGRVAQELGDEAAAIVAYEQAALEVRALTERAGSYTPEVVASHREPYQRLFGIHAARGDWEAAFKVVMQLDTLSLLTSEKVPGAGQLKEDTHRHPAPPVIHDPPAVSDVLGAWRGRRLAVVISDELTMWRLEVRDGRVRGAAVGVAAELEELARWLDANPDNQAVADRLGEAILPPPIGGKLRAAAAADGELLEVLLIGAMGRTPLPALRLGGELAIASTPLARALGVLPRRSAAPAPPRTGAAVFGDPNQNLPDAGREAEDVAQRLGVKPLLGAAATRQALAATRGLALLHVAGHSQVTLGGAVLLLADGSIGVDEICQLAPAPAVTVLASCGGAAARDDAGWGSLAAAFLDAGSDAVIAASSELDDLATELLMQELYRRDVAGQPAHALARTQVEMSKRLSPRDWSALEVLRAPPASAVGAAGDCGARTGRQLRAAGP